LIPCLEACQIRCPQTQIPANVYLKTLKIAESFKKTKVYITLIAKALSRTAERRRRPTAIPAVLRVEFPGCEAQNVGLAERRNYIPPAVVLLLIVCFFVAGMAVIPYAGIQNDEVLFAAGIYSPQTVRDFVLVFHRPVATMLMTYLGALKAWIYSPIFALWTPSVYSLRVPVLVLGAFTIWLFYLLLSRILGRRAVVAGCALLATDSTYLYTTCFDWGPVLLQHILMVGGVLLVVRFHQTSSRVALGAGFFLFGLALWDKTLFGWTLAGMLLGLLAANPGALRRAISMKNLLVIVFCFGAGAYPLLRFNLRNSGETLRANVGWSAEPAVLRMKVGMLQHTLGGSGLLEYLSFGDGTVGARRPRTALEKASVELDEHRGDLRNGWLAYAMGAALLLLPAVWKTRARRPMIFALIVMAVVWSQMLFGVGVGGSVHHTVLLWPWPQFFAAAGLTEASRRLRRAGLPALVLVIALVSGSNVVVANIQFSQLIRNGGGLVWTDAVFGLSDYLPTVPAEHYVLLDWGLTEPLRLLHKGRMPLAWGGDYVLKDTLGEEDRRGFLTMIQATGNVYVSHTEPYQVFEGVNRRLDRLLEREGYRKQPLASIPDSNGRNIFEVFRIVKGPPAASSGRS
jgi:hypothetical protein